MVICSHCSHKNPVGTLICEQCHQSLFKRSSDARVTQQIASPPDLFPQAADPDAAKLQGTATIFLHIQDETRPLQCSTDQDLVIGRRDPANHVHPDLDLTPYQAHEMGVSRVHAAIRCRDELLTLVDLGSSNGTYLNGKRLVPNQPDVLHDGDEIRLGNFAMRIYLG